MIIKIIRKLFGYYSKENTELGKLSENTYKSTRVTKRGAVKTDPKEVSNDKNFVKAKKEQKHC